MKSFKWAFLGLISVGVCNHSQAADHLLVTSFESGNSANGAIVKFDQPSGTLVETTSGAFASPKALIHDADQKNLFIGGESSVLRYNYADGNLYHVTNASMVEGITRDHCGNLFITERTLDRVRVISAAGNDMLTIDMFPNATPMGLAFDNLGRLAVASRGGNGAAFYTLSYDGCTVTGATMSGGTAINNCGPTGIAFDQSGNLYASCAANGRILKYSRTGAALGTFATTPTIGGFSSGNRNLLWHNNQLHVANMNHHMVHKFSSSGAYVTSIGGGNLLSPQGIAVKRENPNNAVEPTFTMSKQSDGAIALNVVGAPNTLLGIEQSSDLNTWENLGSVTTDAAGTGSFTDSTATGASRKFYRLKYSTQ